MELIHVITIDMNGLSNIKTFSIIDEKDTSGVKKAEEEFSNLISELIKNNDPEIIESELIDIIDIALIDGFYSHDDKSIYIRWNNIE